MGGPDVLRGVDGVFLVGWVGVLHVAVFVLALFRADVFSPADFVAHCLSPFADNVWPACIEATAICVPSIFCARLETNNRVSMLRPLRTLFTASCYDCQRLIYSFTYICIFIYLLSKK